LEKSFGVGQLALGYPPMLSGDKDPEFESKAVIGAG